MADLQEELQRLSGTTLDTAGAANAWAGTTNLELVGALNEKAGLTANPLELAGVLNYLAGTTNLGVNGAAAAIQAGPLASDLQTQSGDHRLTQTGSSRLLQGAITELLTQSGGNRLDQSGTSRLV